MSHRKKGNYERLKRIGIGRQDLGRTRDLAARKVIRKQNSTPPNPNSNKKKALSTTCGRWLQRRKFARPSMVSLVSDR